MPKYKDMHAPWIPSECVSNPRGNVFPSKRLKDAWNVTYFLMVCIECEVRLNEWNAKHASQPHK